MKADIRIRELPAIYCTKCGVVLENTEKFSHYDSEFGWRMYYVISVCPNRKHWWDGHDGGYRDFGGGWVEFASGEWAIRGTWRK
jgi:hypothetical protein